MKINGAVIPLPTPFDKNLEVDYKGLENYVNFLAESGIKNVMTTVGTSRYNLLSWEECLKVNEVVARTANNAGIVSIVANPPSGDLDQAKKFAEHAENIKADFFLVYFPDRYYGDKNTVSFFNEIDKGLSNTFGLIHEMPIRNGLGPGSVPYSIELLRQILSLEHFSGMKEEALDPVHSNRILDEFGGKYEIVGAGGGMSRFLERDFERKATAYLGGIGNFIPQIEIDFFNYLASGDKNKAEHIVYEVEKPYFELIAQIGWHPSLKIALNMFNLMSDYERPPMKILDEQEKNTMNDFFLSRKWK